MLTTILATPPISGSMPEYRFDRSHSYTWVRFEDSDGSLWAGVFGDGDVMKHHRAAVPFADDATVFVNANGKGYVIDALAKTRLYRTSIDYWATALTVPERDFVIAAEFTTIAAIGRTRELWNSERIARDGIILDDSTSTRLEGKVWWQDGWYAFELKYDGWLYSRREQVASDWGAFPDPSA